MGSGLRLLAAVQVILAFGRGTAHADGKPLARQLFELGVEEYKTKQYEAAALSMAKSFALDPQPQALYALAQAERLGGNCKDAIPHYEKLLELQKDDATQKAVGKSIDLCKQIEAGKAPPVDPKAKDEDTAQRDAPILQIRTVYRTEKKSDAATIALYVAGGVSLSGSVALYLFSRSSRSEADRAQSLDEYNDRYDRAQRLELFSYGAAGLGLGLITYATIRVVTRGGKTKETSQVGFTPTAGGSMVSWSGSW